MIGDRVHQLQDKLAQFLGLALPRRSEIVAAMMQPTRGDAAGYWIQLLMATVLATLGLALDSAAVVIGAMLVAPLMRPIIELAMGLATGSATLTFRAGGRAAASIGAVIAASAAISWFLPFHEVTEQLAARTAPSLLDLFVAAACAVVGAYATMFASNDTASTAAGTSIGISLVPPLCTVGYGLATTDWPMARGAALLFTANVTGILVVAGAAFLAVGFRHSLLDQPGDGEYVDLAARLGRGWSSQARRLGPLARILLPAALLGAIYLPLNRAVDEMSQRAALRQELHDAGIESGVRVAQTTIDTTGRHVTIRAIVIGSDADAQLYEQRMRVVLARHDEVSPRIAVWAVPDASMVGDLAARLDEAPQQKPTPPPPPPSLQPPKTVTAVIRSAWPRAAPPPIDIDLRAAADGPIVAQITHLGPAVGAAALEMIARAIDPSGAITVRETVIAADADTSDPLRWAIGVIDVAARAAAYPELVVCVTAPPVPKPVRGRAPPPAPIHELLTRTAAVAPHLRLADGEAWSAVVQRGPCPTPPPATPAPATP